jgi:hypothetical protein
VDRAERPLLIILYASILLQFLLFAMLAFDHVSASTGSTGQADEDDRITLKDITGWIVTAITAGVASTIAALALWHNAKTTRTTQELTRNQIKENARAAEISQNLTRESLKLTAKSMELDANSRYVEFLKSTSEELTKILESPERQLSSRHRDKWEINFLNAVDRIALLLNKNRIPEDIANYFRQDIAYARHIIENSPNRAEREKSYEDIIKICTTKGWEPLDLDRKDG